MKRVNFGGYEAELDAERSRRWYEKAGAWGCTCGHCRNFLALARQRALPGAVLEQLDRLGIPAEKATYVCEMYPAEGGFCYQFSYRLAGRILREPEESSGGWLRCCREPYPYGAPGFDEPHFDLEFWLVLPWVLPEAPEG